MSAFYEELYKYISPELVSTAGGHKVVLYNSYVTVVEGHRGLKCLTSARVSFKLRQGFLEINGSNLSVAVLTKGQAIVVGEIANVEITR